MKELTTEQKAQRYDEVIKRANSLLSDNQLGNAWIYKLLPELKESEDEKIRKELLQIANESEDSFYMVMTPDKRKRLIAWLEKQGEQRTTWSEDDEHKLLLLEALCDDQINSSTSYSTMYREMHELKDWLKSLKDRVQPKPRQEWKQENTGDLTYFENAMMHIGDSFFGQHAGLDPNDTNAIKEQANRLLELVSSKGWSEEDEKMIECVNNCIDELEKEHGWLYVYVNNKDIKLNEVRKWLNSIRTKNWWKPAEEQIDALEHFVRSVGESGYASPYDNETKLIYSLLEQLKQL